MGSFAAAVCKRGWSGWCCRPFGINVASEPRGLDSLAWQFLSEAFPWKLVPLHSMGASVCESFVATVSPSFFARSPPARTPWPMAMNCLRSPRRGMKRWLPSATCWMCKCPVGIGKRSHHFSRVSRWPTCVVEQGLEGVSVQQWLERPGDLITEV